MFRLAGRVRDPMFAGAFDEDVLEKAMGEAVVALAGEIKLPRGVRYSCTLRIERGGMGKGVDRSHAIVWELTEVDDG